MIKSLYLLFIMKKIKIMKYFEKRKLVKYKKKLENPKVSFPSWYLESQKNRIEWLDWLISYYDGDTASTPKELLEAVLRKRQYQSQYQDYADEMKGRDITPISEIDWLRDSIEWADFLYQWVYYKKITGF